MCIVTEQPDQGSVNKVIALCCIWLADITFCHCYKYTKYMNVYMWQRSCPCRLEETGGKKEIQQIMIFYWECLELNLKNLHCNINNITFILTICYLFSMLELMRNWFIILMKKETIILITGFLQCRHLNHECYGFIFTLFVLFFN